MKQAWITQVAPQVDLSCDAEDDEEDYQSIHSYGSDAKHDINYIHDIQIRRNYMRTTRRKNVDNWAPLLGERYARTANPATPCQPTLRKDSYWGQAWYLSQRRVILETWRAWDLESLRFGDLEQDALCPLHHLDPVEVSTVSAELRAGIEGTPVVVFGKRHPFLRTKLMY